MTTDTQREMFEALIEVQRQKFEENLHKGGWITDSVSSLKRRVIEELNELQHQLEWDGACSSETDHERRADNILREAADVANMVMMLGDVAANQARMKEKPILRSVFAHRNGTQW